MVHRTTDHDLIISTYQQGWSVPDISRQLDVSDKLIYSVLKLHGIALRPRSGVGKVLTSAQDAEIMASYRAGVTATELAASYGVSSATIYSTSADGQGVGQAAA
jgi:Mor family transcriptional regulator